MQQDWLKDRFQELTKLADARQIDWQSSLKGIASHDDRRRVAAIATLLELSVGDVFNPQLSISEVEKRDKQVSELEQRKLRFQAAP